MKNYPDWLRALSIKPLYAWQILQGYKLEEYRTWKTNRRGIFLIHVSSSKDTDDVLIEDCGLQLADIDRIRGSIIGASTITDCQPSENEGEWAFSLMGAVTFPEPLKCKGKLNFWQARTDNQIAAFNKAWSAIALGASCTAYRKAQSGINLEYSYLKSHL
uniref:ASCH domain-containing protein n=2 Tax=Tolypothrix TaxID=111782 RepID=A0A0C1NGK9_9CYAN